MSKGVNIPIAADAGQVISAGKKIEGALDQVIDSLDSVGDQSQATARDVDTQLGKVENSAKDAATTLERKFSEAFDQVKKDAKTTGDKVDTEMHTGTGKAGEAVGEFKSEAVSNLSEVASSFSGDITQAVDGVQGILGGLAQTDIPGVGLAAGAAGLLFGAAFGQMQRDAEATKAAVSALFEDMIASGSKWASEALITENVKAIVQDSGKLGEAQNKAKESGADLGVVLRAMAGDASAALKVQGSYNDAIAAHKQKVADLHAEMAAHGDDPYQVQKLDAAITSTEAEIVSLERSRDGYGKYSDEVSKAREQIDALYQAQQAQTSESAVNRAKADNETEGVKAMGDAYDAARQKAAGAWTTIGNPPAAPVVKLTVDDSEVQAWLRKPKQFTAGVVVRPGQVQVM